MASLKEAIQRMESSLDRFHEAHFWIHSLEQFYHYAEPFRWHLNAFLKSVKEVPLLIQMELQNQRGFPVWFRTEKRRLDSDPLLRFLAKKRDFVVHRGMLVPKSHGGIGLTEGRGLKAGFTLPFDPLENSDDAMNRYLRVIAEGDDPLGLLLPDDDSLPCVYRIWKIPPFDEDLVDLAARAWLRMEETVRGALQWLGADPPKLELKCRHSSQQCQFKMYDRKILSSQLRDIRKTLRGKRKV